MRQLCTTRKPLYWLRSSVDNLKHGWSIRRKTKKNAVVLISSTMSNDTFHAEVCICAKDASDPTQQDDGTAPDVNRIQFHEAVLDHLEYRYPVKLWIPRGPHMTPKCLWIYGVQFGGGIVEGDHVKTSITVRKNCCAVYTSLGYGKAYSGQPEHHAKLKQSYAIEENACLVVLPDPFMAYRDATITQEQDVSLRDDSSGIVLLDWYTAGRTSLEENWAAKCVHSKVLVRLKGRRIYHDAMRLEQMNTKSLPVPSAMGKYKIFGSCLVIGNTMSALLRESVQTLVSAGAYGQPVDPSVITSCSPVFSDFDDCDLCGYVIRFCCYTTTQAYATVSGMLEPVFAITGGNPFDKYY